MKAGGREDECVEDVKGSRMVEVNFKALSTVIKGFQMV